MLPTRVESCRQVIMAITWVLNQLLAAVQPPAIRAMNQMTQYLFSASVMLAGTAFVLCCKVQVTLFLGDCPLGLMQPNLASPIFSRTAQRRQSSLPRTLVRTTDAMRGVVSR